MTSSTVESTSRARRLRDAAVKRRLFAQGCTYHQQQNYDLKLTEVVNKLDLMQTQVSKLIDLLAAPMQYYHNPEWTGELDSMMYCNLDMDMSSTHPHIFGGYLEVPAHCSPNTWNSEAPVFEPTNVQEEDLGAVYQANSHAFHQLPSVGTWLLTPIAKTSWDCDMEGSVEAAVLKGKVCDDGDFTLWKAGSKAFIKPDSATSLEWKTEAAQILQAWFRRNFRRSTSSQASEDDSADDDFGDDSNLEVVWLPLAEWRLATGFLNMELSCIRTYYMGDQKGVRDFDTGKWYKIASGSCDGSTEAHNGNDQPDSQEWKSVVADPDVNPRPVTEHWTEDEVQRFFESMQKIIFSNKSLSVEQKFYRFSQAFEDSRHRLAPKHQTLMQDMLKDIKHAAVSEGAQF